MNEKILFIKFVADRVREGKWKMEKLGIYSVPISEKLRWRDNMGYITNEIGDGYKKWGESDWGTKPETIFISSPTGSGKTTFILNTFLPYWASKGKKLLYLVNRTILKEQLENNISNLEWKLRQAIKIELYQTIEKEITKLQLRYNISEYEQGYSNAMQTVGQKYEPRCYKEYSANFYNNDILRKYDEFDCVVCDEAHYFLMDSNYNTNTMFSYIFIREFFKLKLRIYISATIEEIKKYIVEDNNKMLYYRTNWYGFCSDKCPNIEQRLNPCKYKEFLVQSNYDYIDIGILKQREEIADIITGGTEKWLIFVDNKEFGKTLKKDIMEKISVEEDMVNKSIVAFITSDYEQDSDSANEIKSIVSTDKQNAKVLIATSVLDNGINLKDVELRNMIIITDTETEFIQMLGRKRIDNQRLKLYIYKQSKEHFTKRNRINQKRRKVVEEYYEQVYKLIQPNLDAIVSNRNAMLNYIITDMEDYYIAWQHKFLMQKIADNNKCFEDIRASFAIFDGKFFLNLLSRQNIENLNQFYNRIIEDFDKEEYGENAFLWEQLRWLHKSDDEIAEIISRESISHYERSKQNVIEAFGKIVGQTLKKEEFIKIKEGVRNELLDLIESVGKDDSDYKKYCDLVKKSDRVISKYFMDFLREKCEIPFILETNETGYTMRAVED